MGVRVGLNAPRLGDKPMSVSAHSVVVQRLWTNALTPRIFLQNVCEVHSSHRHVLSICPLLSQLKQPGVVSGVGVREEDAAELQRSSIGIWGARAGEASNSRASTSGEPGRAKRATTLRHTVRSGVF